MIEPANPLVHPLTGILLAGDEDLVEIVQTTDALISKHYECARRYREANDAIKRHLADQGRYELPKKTARTKTQERISRCPRCGDHPE